MRASQRSSWRAAHWALAMASCGTMAAAACTSGVGGAGGYSGNGVVWASGADGAAAEVHDTAQGDVPVVKADESAGPDALGDPENLTTDEDIAADPDMAIEPDVPDAPDVAAPTDTGKSPDIAKPADIKNDIAPDVAPDTCGAGNDVLSLLACTEGPVDFLLLDVTVTYTFPAGFLVFDASSTRGMMIYVGSTPNYPNPKAGDRVSLHVSKYTSFDGQQEVTGSDGLQFVGTSDAAAMMLDVGKLTKTSFTEVYESRALTGKGLVLKSLVGADGIVTTPGAGDVTIRLDGGAKLCVGAVFELKAAALTQHGTGMRLQVMNGAADLGVVDDSKCGVTAPGYDTSNWGFEQAAATDPPPGFLKVGAALNATRTTAQAHGGTASAQLTWVSADNQDLVAGYQQPVQPGQKATLAMWLLDSDPAGKARLCLTFYKADKTTVVANQFQSTYSVDSAAWAQRSFEFVAPAEALFVRGFVRLYDDTKWAGTATIYTDDWSLAVQ